MTGRDRAILAALGLGALAAVIAVWVMVTALCPEPTAGDPCPDATRNQALVIGVGAVAVALMGTAVAFIVDFATHRRIAYRGAWLRAARRGGLLAVALAALAGLRVVDALNLFSAGAVVGVAAAAEWLAIRRVDEP